MTPLTYEGLLNELFCSTISDGDTLSEIGYEFGRVCWESGVNSSGAINSGVSTGNNSGVSDATDTTSAKNVCSLVKLNDIDPIFAEIRNLTIEHIGPRLQQVCYAV